MMNILQITGNSLTSMQLLQVRPAVVSNMYTVSSTAWVILCQLHAGIRRSRQPSCNSF